MPMIESIGIAGKWVFEFVGSAIFCGIECTFFCYGTQTVSRQLITFFIYRMSLNILGTLGSWYTVLGGGKLKKEQNSVIQVKVCWTALFFKSAKGCNS